MVRSSPTPSAYASPTAYLTGAYEGFDRDPSLTTQSARDEQLIDAMIAHVRAPLDDLVVAGYAPKHASDNLLVRHLEFFDRDQSGSIRSTENYNGWRAVGLSPFRSATQTVGSAVVFNGGLRALRPTHLTAAVKALYSALASDSMPAIPALELSVQAAMAHRPTNPSGVYDAAGHLNEPRFRAFIASFLAYARGVRAEGQPTDSMAPEQFLVFLGTEAVRDLARTQFKSMLSVLENCGGDGYVRPIHLASMYSGAFMYNAQAVLAAQRDA